MSSNILLVVSAEDKASAVLENIKSKVFSAQQSVIDSNARIEAANSKVAISFENQIKAAAGLASVAAGVVSFAASFSRLEAASINTERAMVMQDKATRTLSEAQERHEKLMLSGTASADQLADAERDVAIARDSASVATQRAALAQDNLRDTYMVFAANVAPQVISMTVGTITAFRNLGITSLAQIPIIGALSAAHVGHAVSMGVVSTAYHTASLAVKAFQIATGPVGWAILGISTLVALLATNTFGLRDAFVAAGKFIIDFLDQHLRPLADAIRWVVDALRPLSDIMGFTVPQAVQTASDSIYDFNTQVIATIPPVTALDESSFGASQSLQNLGNAALETSLKFPPLEEGGIRVIDSMNNLIQVSEETDITFGTRFVPAMQQAADVSTETAGKITVAATEVKSALDTLPPKVRQVVDALTQSLQEGGGAFVSLAGAAQASAAQTASAMTNLAQSVAFAKESMIRDAAEARNAALSITQTAGGTTIVSGVPVQPLETGLPSKYMTQALQDLYNRGYRSVYADDPLAVATAQNIYAREQDAALRAKYAEAGISLITQSGNALPAGNKWGATGFYSLTQEEFYKANPNYIPTLNKFSSYSPEQIAGMPVEMFRQQIVKAQHGYEGWVNRPTMFMAGEAGREHVKISPDTGDFGMGVVKIIFSDYNGNEFDSVMIDRRQRRQIKRMKSMLNRIM